MPRATWFCIDIECSGPVPALYDLISLGAVAVTASLTIGPKYYVEVKPTAPRVDPGAMKVNRLDLERLKREVSFDKGYLRIRSAEAHSMPSNLPGQSSRLCGQASQTARSGSHSAGQR